MEINEAFDILLKRDKITEALEFVRNNKAESENILIEKLQCAIKCVEEGQGNELDGGFGSVLGLLAELEVKNSFGDLVKILEYKGSDVFFGFGRISPQFFGTVLSKTISDEKDISRLEDYVMGDGIQEANRLAAYCALQIFCGKDAKKRQYMEALNKKVILSLSECDYFECLELFFAVIECSLHEEFYDIYEDIRALLVKWIIESSDGYNFSAFKDYFEYLYKIEPLIPARIHNVKKYILSLWDCADVEIFQFDNLSGVGKYLFSKILGAVESADCDIIKMAVKQLNHYPFNDRAVPCNDEQYYMELCYILDIYEVPQEAYSRAKELYEGVFVKDYGKVKQSIQTLIAETKRQKVEIEKSEKIITESKDGQWLPQKVEENKLKLIEYHFRMKELDALYKYENSVESGLLIYYSNALENILSSFCENADDAGKIDEKIRMQSIKCTCSKDTSVDDVFAPYSKVIHQLEALLDGSPAVTLYNIFYKVKFIPFAEQIRLEYLPRFMSEDCNINVKAELEERINTHPLNPKTLPGCFKNNVLKYQRVLEGILDEAVTQIEKGISGSICLRKRKTVIEHCLFLIKDGNYEPAINLMPVQIEGMFVDLLEYSSVYRYINDIKQYKSILNLDLVYKIEFALGKDINLSFDAVAYFKYYFNNIVRNTVAHGNYGLLVQGRRAYKEDSPEDGDVIKKIIALELLLDLNYLVYVIANINEIDTADRYIDEVYENYSSNKNGDIEIFYGCMFEDLAGMRNRFKLSDYKRGLFVTYEPLQLFYWIFNPYYEKYLDTEKLNEIRKVVCSYGFWDFVAKKFPTKGAFIYKRFKAEEFQKIINRMFKMNLEDGVRQVIIRVNAKLKDF